jgi:NAD+ diphosphatase
MSLTYTGMPLDRCTNQRKNKAWLKRQFNSHKTLFALIHDGDNFFQRDKPLTPLYLRLDQLLGVSVNSCVFLGKDESVVMFALDSNKLNFADLQAIEQLGVWQQLRQLGSVIPAVDAAILALAKGLVFWHRTHLYCGKCGSLSQLIEAGHARRCTNSDCHKINFPRTDPAVIMLVERMFDDGVARCLLGRQRSWPSGVYSTLAGFVDPGESLDEAVTREVHEESGINVEDVSYVRSQPWPFPASVMLGFTAVASTEAIDVSNDDLETAQWFSRQQLQLFASREDSKEGNHEVQQGQYKYSSSDSIAYFLIQAWKNKQIGTY